MKMPEDQLLLGIKTAIKNEFENPFGKPTDIIGFNEVGQFLAKNLEPIIGRKEICFFDENIKSDPIFHYLDFEKMLEKSEIMIFTTELSTELLEKISQINKNTRIFMPSKFKKMIKIFETSGLKGNLVIV